MVWPFSRRTKRGVPYRMFDSAHHGLAAKNARVLERIYHKSQSQSWDGKEVLESLIAEHGTPYLDDEKKRALGRVFSLILWGELAAWRISAELADEIEPLEAKMAATAQAFDEARHFYVMHDYLTALDAVPDEATIWAGYVGIVFNPDAPFPAGSPAEDQPPAGQWEFIGGGAVPETRLCSFDGAFGADARDYDPALGFLALVKDKPPLEANGSSSDFCFGTPDEAIPLDGCTGAGRTCYEERFGHFMCARPEAAPGPYAL